jgi:hypothetical protein
MFGPLCGGEVVAMLVQIRSQDGNVLARQVVDDPEAALELGQKWLALMIEDVSDPLYTVWDTPAIEVLPEV